MKKRLNLRFPLTISTINFSRELEERYFPPGTPSNKDFELIVYPDAFHIIVPDTPKNRSAISVIAHKYGIMPPQPLTKFDEYMELFYKGRITEARDKICNDALDYVQKHFMLSLKNHGVITQVFCNKEMWNMLGEKWDKKHFGNTVSATIAPNFTFDAATGSIHPMNGHYLILLNSQVFDKMSPQDHVFNYALTIFHEFVHIAGVKDDVKVHMLEFKFSRDVLGIYYSREHMRKKYREIKEFLARTPMQA